MLRTLAELVQASYIPKSLRLVSLVFVAFLVILQAERLNIYSHCLLVFLALLAFLVFLQAERLNIFTRTVRAADLDAPTLASSLVSHRQVVDYSW